ncbi:hypothetical protein ACJJIF_06395 [Microbulbifer sp. SSSA002]|uniref:hypothetical protein n=1 Tax=Microbulbifer sp. SSSA002 TaxID=3243376 RepID=UPI00403954D5
MLDDYRLLICRHMDVRIKHMLLTTKVSLVLLFLAVFILIYAVISYMKYRWVVFEHPVDVTKNKRYEVKFCSQLNAPHELTLEAERALDSSELNSRLGIKPLRRETCTKYSEALAIEWVIYEEGATLASGSSGDTTSGFWGKKAGKLLHIFTTKKGKNYTLVASVTAPDPVLAVTNPALKVAVGRVEHKSAYVYSSLCIFTAYLLAAIAAVTWLFGFIYNWLT